MHGVRRPGSVCPAQQAVGQGQGVPPPEADGGLSEGVGTAALPPQLASRLDACGKLWFGDGSIDASLVLVSEACGVRGVPGASRQLCGRG